MNDVVNFVKMSKYAGERFDLIQAGGGNSSVKLDNGQMLIKASGYLLSDVETEKGYASLDHVKVIEALNDPVFSTIELKREREKYAAQLVGDALLSPDARPSIETFLHSLLYKFTLHTHPIVVNIVTCQKDWEKRLRHLFDDKAIYVQYETPGIELALAMNSKLIEYRHTHDTDPQIVFLQNHGVIVSADKLDDVIRINEEIMSVLEKEEKVDFSRYKYTNRISSLVNSLKDTSYITYLSEDIHVSRLVKNESLLAISPFCPDGYVFCGTSVLKLQELKAECIANYVEYNHELPKVIVYNTQVFFVAANVKKAKEMEEVFKFHLLTIDQAEDEINTLSTEEIHYLGNWEAEKYRQKL